MRHRIYKLISLFFILLPIWGGQSCLLAEKYPVMQGPQAETSRFEPSGILFDRQSKMFYVFNDKNDEPPVYGYRLEKRLVLTGNIPLTDASALPADVRKFEDASASRSGGRGHYAVTSCDRSDPLFNKLLKMSVLPGGAWTFEEVPTFPRSMQILRERLETPYMKIEALALSPDDAAAYLGVREVGPNYKKPRYVAMIWRISLASGEIDPVKILEIDTKATVGRTEGISALEYDDIRRRYLMLTSYEGEGEGADDVGGHLWSIPVGLLDGGEMLGEVEVIKTFQHKPEGVAVADDGTIVVVFDDDASRKEADPEKALKEKKFNVRQNEAFYMLLD